MSLETRQTINDFFNGIIIVLIVVNFIMSCAWFGEVTTPTSSKPKHIDYYGNSYY